MKYRRNHQEERVLLPPAGSARCQREADELHAPDEVTSPRAVEGAVNTCDEATVAYDSDPIATEGLSPIGRVPSRIENQIRKSVVPRVKKSRTMDPVPVAVSFITPTARGTDARICYSSRGRHRLTLEEIAVGAYPWGSPPSPPHLAGFWAMRSWG